MASWMSFMVILLFIVVYASVQVPCGEAAKVPEEDAQQCARDVDCAFKQLPKCKGFFVCDHGKCVCIPGKDSSPDVDAQQCARDVDCSFKKLPKCKGFFVCDHGKCVCIPGKVSSPDASLIAN